MDTNPLETERVRRTWRLAAVATVRGWYDGWVRYHEARYRYLGAILDDATIPARHLPRCRTRQRLNSRGDAS